MEVQFNDPRFDSLESDPDYTLELPRVVTEYRICLQLLRAAASNADLAALRQLNLSDVSASPSGYKAIPLTDGYNLVLKPNPGSSSTSIRIMEIARSDRDASAK
jgi:plasmid maintenance system killer protein